MLTTKTFQQRINVTESSLYVDAPFDFLLERFKEKAKKIFYEIEEISWFPILDKERKIVQFEFVATGTIEE